MLINKRLCIVYLFPIHSVIVVTAFIGLKKPQYSRSLCDIVKKVY